MINYTSYWAMSNLLKSNNIVPIGISRYPPKNIVGIDSFKTLSPPLKLFLDIKSNLISAEEYDLKYRDYLLSLDVNLIYSKLLEISRGSTFALICFEKPGDHCHRHLASEWFINNGFPFKEFKMSKNGIGNLQK